MAEIRAQGRLLDALYRQCSVPVELQFIEPVVALGQSLRPQQEYRLYELALAGTQPSLMAGTTPRALIKNIAARFSDGNFPCECSFRPASKIFSMSI